MSRKIEINKDTSNTDDQKSDNEVAMPVSKQKERKEKAVDDKVLKSKVKKKDAEIKHLKKEIGELKVKYLQQLADKENLRKRLEREKSEFYQNALNDTLIEFLCILDNFERALQSDIQDSEKVFRDGVEMIYKMFISVLTKQGVHPIEINNTDTKFDPRYHQAFATEESGDVSEPMVGEVYQKGYTLKDRLLRPSLVKVIIPKKEKK